MSELFLTYYIVGLPVSWINMQMTKDKDRTYLWKYARRLNWPLDTRHLELALVLLNAFLWPSIVYDFLKENDKD